MMEVIIIAMTLCHVEPGLTGWHYRTKIPPLPDQKCYYFGERMKPRRELYWAETPKEPPKELEVSPKKFPWELEPRWHGD